MSEEYKAVYEGGEGELIEKKSRFIATVIPAESEEEALAFIEAMKKKYWNATHNCSAYVIGEKGQLKRCSDDGEPSGTAGKPILEVIRGAGLHNIFVVVTRYFGGTLLGTGGLVRAYTESAREGISHSQIITKIYGFKLNLTTDYTGLGKIQYLLGQRGLREIQFFRGCRYTFFVGNFQYVTKLVELHKKTSFCMFKRSCHYASIRK